MVGKTTVINELKKFKQTLQKEIAVPKLILFGSVADGTANKDSDVDLIVVSPAFSKLNFFKRGALMYDYWKPLLPVDFLCFTPEEFEQRKKGATIVSHALKTGIVI